MTIDLIGELIQHCHGSILVDPKRADGKKVG